MILDLHLDVVLQNHLFGYDALKKHAAGIPGQPMFWHSDLPRLHEAAFKGACLGVHHMRGESEDAWAAMNAQIDYIDHICKEDPKTLRVRSPGQWLQAQHQGKLALAPGIEGAHMLNQRLDRVAQIAARGAAYLTLAHLRSNAAASTGWGKGQSDTAGLTGFGRDLVKELEAHDVLIDLAHVNTPGVLEACRLATKPLVCSHTGARGLRRHPRLITDAEIDAIAGTGGVMGVIFSPYFLASKLFASSDCVIDHMEYIAERVGLDHVAIGTDLDGWMVTIPYDMRDCRDIDVIPENMAKRGYSEAEIKQVCFGNATRVLQRASL